VTLRRRIFLLVSGIVVLLLVGETLLVRSLAGQLDRDVATVVVSVGEDLLSTFELRPGTTVELQQETQRFVARPGGAAGSGAPDPGSRESAAGGGFVVRHQLWVSGEAGTPAGAAAPESPAGGEREGSELGLAPGTWKMRELPPELLEGTPAGAPFRILEQSATSERLTLVPHERGQMVFLRGPRFERRLRIPTGPVASTVEKFESRLLLGSIGLLALGLMATALVVHRATRPLDELRGAAERVGAGEWGVSIPVSRADDEVGAAVAAFNTMSTRLAELDRENRRLADSEHLSELAEVARGLAHTLRNPLNALGLAVERLAGENPPERAEELAERCRRQIRRIDSSLRSFLALASAPAAAAEPVEIGTLAREVALEALQDAAGRIRVEVDAPGRVEIAGVAAELKAALQALVVNACEASPEDGVVRVRVRAGEEGGARIEIDDEGAGIAPEVAAKLFAPHVTTKPHGSGMGLYLARRLATTRYGGSVELAARTPRGTRATVNLTGRSEVSA